MRNVFGRFGLLVLVCALLLTRASPAQDLTGTSVQTFSDGTFSVGDWTQGPVVLSNNSAGANQTNQQIVTGGNPGEFWRFSTTFSAVGSSAYQIAYFKTSAVYDPSISGAIVDMSGGFTHNLLSSPTIFDVFDTSIVLRQSGTTYIPSNYYGLQDVAPGWYGGSDLFSSTGIEVASASDWHKIDGAGPTTPNFSGSGSPIQFGLMAGGALNSGSGTIVGGVDNWTISIVHVPEPQIACLLFGVVALRAGIRGRVKKSGSVSNAFRSQ